MTTPKLWRGQTLQDRSNDRRETFLAAAEELLGSGGAAAVTMRAVVRAANLSPRYFYESFTNREEVLTAVYDRVSVQLLERLGDVTTTGEARADVRELLEAMRVFFEDDPRRARILLREPLADDTLREHRAVRTSDFVRAVLPMVVIVDGDEGIGRQRTDVELEILSTALAGALVALYLDYVDGRMLATQEELVPAAVDLVFAIAGSGGGR